MVKAIHDESRGHRGNSAGATAGSYNQTFSYEQRGQKTRDNITSGVAMVTNKACTDILVITLFYLLRVFSGG